MSKTVAAQCQAEIVTVQGFPVEGATILSGGKGSSQGIAVLDEDKAYYVASSSPDIESLLTDVTDAMEKMMELMQKVNTAIPSLSSYPSFAADAVEITASIEKLKTLKGNLI